MTVENEDFEISQALNCHIWFRRKSDNEIMHVNDSVVYSKEELEQEGYKILDQMSVLDKSLNVMKEAEEER